MDSRAPAGGMPRRAFLAAALSGASAIVLASCTGTPAPSVSPTPTVSPSPSFTPGPGPDGLPPLTALRRSRWGADPWARGAFSYPAVGSTDAMRTRLAQPVRDRLWIAGEACSVEAPGTMHGAIASGAAAADDLARVAEDGERVVVVGAGLAGLTAANALAERGFRVTVIEGRDRAGGRVDSVDDAAFGGSGSVQLGALIAGEDDALDEALVGASVDTHLLQVPDFALAPDGAWVFVRNEGADVIRQAHEWALTQPSDVSLAAALVRSGATSNLSPIVDDHGLRTVDWVVRAIASGVEPATGAPTSKVSAQAFDPERVGRTLRVVTGRLGDLVDDLVAGVDIAVNSTVTHVRYDDRRVSLRLDSGESFTADRAIVTAPLGVLKTDMIDFSPSLPYGHQRAISLLGYGLVDVVWLRFESAFWRSDAPPGTGSGDGGDDGSGDGADAPGIDQGEEVDPEPSATPDILTVVGSTPSVAAWLDVGRATDEPVLVGVMAAGQASRLERLDDAALQAVLLDELVPFATTTG
ncbi:FAD-dependent oxidoreductase [Agromyces sp. MMS24-K17]|uniref:flavin monoamine oxidase family protein n=1 Tax=Agromyces sp. MMS24-K17 TaxID=3372850 RepID=UPI0037551ACB